MSSISYFAPIFKSSLSIDSLESPIKDTSRKRKRDVPGSKIDIDVPSFEAQPTFGALEQASDVERGSRFRHPIPHRSQGSSGSRAKEDIANELASLNPPLHATLGSGDATGTSACRIQGLRQRHLVAVTAILQKCLFDNDYVRAGRAWGMILRAEQSGHTMDLRVNDRWGIGAEILLRRDLQLQKAKDKRRSDGRTIDKSNQRTSSWFSVDGFERAKDYYERLVLQYPFRKLAPNATGPLDFYIAMFGLWIYSVDEQQSVQLASIRTEIGNVHRNGKRTDNESESDSASVPASVSALPPAPNMEPYYAQEREKIRKGTRRHAQDIATRLDGLLASPPYADNAKFRELQDMVALWISDLSIVQSPSQTDLNLDDDSGSSSADASG